MAANRFGDLRSSRSSGVFWESSCSVRNVRFRVSGWTLEIEVYLVRGLELFSLKPLDYSWGYLEITM